MSMTTGSRNHGKTRKIGVWEYMNTPEFVQGFKDARRGKPFPPFTDRLRYEDGRQFCAAFPYITLKDIQKTPWQEHMLTAAREFRNEVFLDPKEPRRL